MNTYSENFKHVILNIFKSCLAYIKSMRLYYAFVTGIPGALGLWYYVYRSEAPQSIPGTVTPILTKKIVILTVLFLSWGVNQIINDYLGQKEDRINAPARPMITGALNPTGALITSIILIIISSLVTFFYLEPIALIPGLLGIILNVLYEYAKGHGILGNIVFGLMITTCPIFGYFAAGPSKPPYFTVNIISLLFLIWLINSLMTFYTYFKDYKGDKRTNKNTIVVKYGLRKARIIAFVSGFLPTIFFILLYYFGFITAELNKIFLLLGILTFGMQWWTGLLFYRYPTGKKAYDSLIVNFKACTCGEATLVALYNKELGLIVFLLTYVLVGFIFHLYTNRKA